MAASAGNNGSDDDLAAAKAVLNGEADALRQMAASITPEFSETVSRILEANGRVICVGLGKSGHVARKIAATLSSTGTAAYFVHPVEASHGDLGMIQSNDIVLALSRSGETAELDDLVQFTRRFDVCLIAMTAARDSALGAAADIVLEIPDAPEACAETNAPTTSTTLMIALGDALAVALLKRRGFDAQNFKMFHPGGKLGAMLKTVGDIMRSGEAAPLVKSGRSLGEGVSIISEKGFGCVGVVDEKGKLIGVITDGDLRRMISAGRTVSTVNEAMTKNPVTAAESDLAAAVLQTMNERKITQIFVVENGAPVGIAHLHDILRAGIA
ncbi:MAG: KpsF/GutQ family sugar-phosphate isomerase [Parvularculaceae bacterium]